MQMRFIDIPVGSIVFNPINGDLHQVKWWNGANDDRMYHSIYSDEEVKYWRHMFLQSDVLVLWKPS
jgi:hypothetical protein